MERLKNSKGITLIALIVTIIVLVIIAGVSMAALTEDNGILNQVNSAKAQQIEAIAREQVKMACAAMRLAIAEAGERDNSYRANNNTQKIQDVLLNTIIVDTQNLNVEGWIKGNINTGEGKFEIIYAGDDYKNACNYEEAKITYTITLGQKSIEFIDEVTGLKDFSGSDIVIDVGNADNKVEKPEKPESIPAPGLYEAGTNYTVLKMSWDDIIKNELLFIDNGILYSYWQGCLITSFSSAEGELVLPSDGSVTQLGYEGGLNETTRKASPFYGNSKLKGVYISNGITIPDYTFAGCESIENIKLANGMTSIPAGAFYGLTNLETIKLPESLISIGKFAFAVCSLKNVTIPENVNRIDAGAFLECANLESVTMLSKVPPVLNETLAGSDEQLQVFGECPKLTQIIVPKGSLNAYKTAALWSNYASLMVEAE